MADTLAPRARSERMSLVRGVDTKPEMAVRRIVWNLGFRYRLHAKELPGRPDIVFRPREKAIFVHGCFWHRHAGCKNCRSPKSRQSFWLPKLAENRRRDSRNQRALRRKGWTFLVVWECELEKPGLVARRIQRFLR